MNKYDKIIVKFFDEQLSVDERKEFERELETNTELKNAFENYRKVNELFSTESDLIVNQDYFNGIVPRFRQNLEKETYISPFGKIGFAFTTILVIISSYLLVQNFFFNQSLTDNSIQSITHNLSDEEMNELADYISDDYWNPISDQEKIQMFEEADFNMEEIVSNVSVEEGVMILSDYQIDDIYSLADEKELELAYNEILTKRIY